MQFTLSINQVKSLEWGLNSQQALLFAFIYSCPSWTTPVKTENGIFFALSKAKIVEELPLLTDKPDTAYRMLKALEEAGLIDLSSTANITLFRLTKKAAEWNKKEDGSEKYPTPPASKVRKNIRSTSEKSPSKVGKKSEQGSDKSPTNQDTSNQDTNQGTSHSLPEGSDKPTQPGVLVLVADQPEAPRVEIPADMPGPKDQTCKTFKAWANYAMAYSKRYQCWPVWNAAAGGILGKLVDRLGVEVAHSVAAYYLTINDARIVNDCHSLNNLIAKAEAYHTQWATGRQMNSRTARQIEDTQANMNAAQEAARLILDGEKRNAFL
ncbi:replication protein (endogenous virus) [Pseudomonas phage phiAH14a]|uniref:Replication protein n=1 Tax=Pseudomonas phage phiAH14a TaxID=1805958 RepID=A0A1B0VME0_9CAUD|nr:MULTISPECIES: phage replication protein [unclassified Pseudomonas]YP_010773062.1 replication protein [Pseudomonas phage phiAH14a]AMW64505.1 replication protein [Pseudomonas phage phiAH14a]KAA0946671.1 phage replication protein [Pseudomonas sp. ANT_H4]KAA0953228.1 phage replication protein [Pseudomonas sp. ANT_H14]